MKVSEQAKVSSNVYIGQNSTVQDGCQIEKSVIGRNVTVGENTTLKQCIVLDEVRVSDNAHFEYCLIEKSGNSDNILSFKAELLD